ncbi:hypothetical protein HK104_009832 [Borealophlyctis nickersoniae]|nr:hypothetical protein HK104_009832 [Borealophlyctis nickersoniae]
MTEIHETEDQLGKGKKPDPADNVTKPGDVTAKPSPGKTPPLDSKDVDDPVYEISDPEQEVDDNAFCDPGFMKMYYADRQHQHDLEERLFQGQSQLVEILNNRGSSSSEVARLNKEKRDCQGRNLQKFHGNKDANAMAVSGFLHAHHDFLDLFDDPAEREGKAYVQHMARHLVQGTASQWWIEAEPSIHTPEAFIAAFRAHFAPVNTQNTVKERLRALRFVLSRRDYTTSFTKLSSEARAAESAAEFSQNDLKTWFLSGLRRSSNEHGKWIADMAMPTAMAMCGARLPTGSQYTWSDVTLPEVHRGWSDEHPPKQRRKADAAPVPGRMCDKREPPKPYDCPNNKDIVCFWCKETGHIKSDCAKFKKYKKEKAKVNNTDAKKEYNNTSSESSAYLRAFGCDSEVVTRLDAVLTATHVADAKNDVKPVRVVSYDSHA